MSTTCSFCVTETFYPLNNNFPQPLAATILLLHIIMFSPSNNLVKRDIHSFSRRDEGYLQGKGKVGSRPWRMRSAEQVELERQHVQREDMGCSRKGGAHPQSSCWWNWSRKNTQEGAEGRGTSRPCSSIWCLLCEPCVLLTWRPGPNLGNMWGEAWSERMEGKPKVKRTGGRLLNNLMCGLSPKAEAGPEKQEKHTVR